MTLPLGNAALFQNNGKMTPPQPHAEGMLDAVRADHWEEPEIEDISPLLRDMFPFLYRPAGIRDVSMAAVRADHTLVPALLTEPGFCGTLAAARHLGQRGVAVRTMGRALGAPTAHSRYVGRHWRSPRMDDIGRRVGLLMQIGRLHPGTVLYPTSDDFAWLQAAHATSLRRYFRMYSPEIEAIENILDKRRLSDACRQVGIEFPESCFAESRADVVAAAQSARFPVLLKQRTQIFSDTKSKGALVHRAADLVAAYDRFVAEGGKVYDIIDGFGADATTRRTAARLRSPGGPSSPPRACRSLPGRSSRPFSRTPTEAAISCPAS